MNKPKDMFGVDWELWSTTYLHLHSAEVKFGCPLVNSVQSVTDVGKKYPGFTSALSTLSALGCSATLSTCVMKYCILNAGRESLTSFMQRTNVLATVESALAIGLSGEELTDAWLSSSHGSTKLDIPDDLNL